MRLFISFFLFTFMFIVSPENVYSQVVDNREVPPEMLRQKPPFEATDRSALSKKNDKEFVILDNSDEISIQEFADTKTTEITLIGNVRIRFSGNFLRAERVIISIQNGNVINIGAYGNVEFTLNNTKFLAHSVNYQPDMERGVMYNVRSTLAANILGSSDVPWFYRAEKITIQSPKRFTIDKASLSTSDTRFDHFALYAAKLWYVQGKVILAAGLEYKAGQASFLWLPALLQFEGAGGVRTSFGSEKRIGYYFINNYTQKTKIGKFDFGFDWYERQGQYFRMDYEAPQVGILREFKARVDLANDVRIVKNGDLYSQWVLPQFNKDGDYERISQFSWHYKLDMTIATNDVSFRLFTEDLNDPFFLSKYSYRSRFDKSTNINFIELINPTMNSWFGYQGDAQPHQDTINRGFALTAGNFVMEGEWELLRVTRPENSNQFLNKYYDYRVRSLSLPELSYDFGNFNIVDVQHSDQSSITVVDSEGREKTMHVSQLPAYEKSLARRSNITILQKAVLQADGSVISNTVTNWEPVTIKEIQTNEYQWIAFSTDINAKTSYSAEHTFGTNSTSTTTDLTLLTNTNWTVVSDVYHHKQQGDINFGVSLFDDIWSIDTGFDLEYNEQWSSFSSCWTNSQRSSGMFIDYTVGTAITPTLEWNADDTTRVAIPFTTEIDYTYPLYRLLRLQDDYIPESFFNWNNSVAFEFFQWQRQPIWTIQLKANWQTRYRVPTWEQQKIIDGNPSDIYIGNQILDRVTVGASTKILWFSIGAETTLDTLQTTTNMPGNQSSFTNRFIGGYPKLVLEFQPDPKYFYIPRLIYRYNLFESEQSRYNRSFNLEFLWDVKLQNYQIPALYPFIYELSEFGFVLRFYQDFVNIRNSFLNLDFVIGVKFTKYLTFRFTSRMLNRSIHLYYGGTFNGQPILAPGETPKDFWTDLGDSFKIWDPAALRRSSFKLQSLNFELIHDLQTWDMRVIFNLGRRVDDVKRVAFWEPYIGVLFTIKGSTTPSVFPEFQKRFVPAEYQ